MLTSWWSRSFVNPKPYKLNKPLALIKRKGSTLGLESHGVRSLGVRKFMVEGMVIDVGCQRFRATLSEKRRDPEDAICFA